MTVAQSSLPITRAPFESPIADVMGNAARHEIKLHQHGFIALVDVMPRLVRAQADGAATADGAIVQAARVSYGHGTKKVSEDRALIRYLLRHHHTTPFEMVEVKFHIAMPIFVARQWIRHRTANVNEYSARYSILPDRFYTPSIDSIRKQSAVNKQGGGETFEVPKAGDEPASEIDTPASQPTLPLRHSATPSLPPPPPSTAHDFLDYLRSVESAYERYLSLTQRGVSRELARIGLPVNVYTEWYWKCDLHNTLRFLALRMDPHAQVEIREYAEAMYALLHPIVPITMEAFRDYELDAIRLTRLEIDAIRSLREGRKGVGGEGGDLATDNKRERAEWAEKRARLGL